MKGYIYVCDRVHTVALTLRLVVEEVVILGHVCDDAKPVRHFHRHHVFWVQQGWNPQFSLGHFKRLSVRKNEEKRIRGKEVERAGNKRRCW